MMDYDLETGLPPKGKKLSRDDLLNVTSEHINHLNKKAMNGRLPDPDIEQMRDRKSRLLCDFIKAHGSLLKDEALESIEQRLKVLEERL